MTPVVLYVAVTPDELELPVYVADTAREMAAWAGMKVASVRQMASRNARHPDPFTRGKGGCVHSEYRVRKVTIEED